MAREYYYLIAGLPDIFLDQERKDFNLIKLKDEMKEMLHPDDYKLVELLFFEYDNYNFQNFLFERKQEFSPLGKFPQEVYNELEDNLDSFPEYIKSFYLLYKGKGNAEQPEETTDYAGEKIEKNPEVRFQEAFHSYIKQFDNRFISRWFSFIRNLNNVLTAISCRKHNMEIAPQMVGGGELVETLTRSQAPDFGLKREVDYIEPLLQITEVNDIMERERRLDLLKWEMADDLTTFDYFNIERILAFFVKAGMVHRWSKLDAKVGAEMFEKLVKELRETYELPKEFEK
ncbi:DUF2764 family protein [Perlabentimonas gracilis]|jgi:hypothetical protein|uniref:DUF2764 family protein n=1 Tax=Perlabentimonas gracilis TaxID=2715279 RepID=UPI00140C95E4|nr:DUF2764 family protein [Perlabentimonas gracilis]NHB68526.1 DUF2764 family protein [Perlabentimonas gracilis]